MLLLDIGNFALKGQWREDGTLRLSFSCRYQTGWEELFLACLRDIRGQRCFYSSVQDTQFESAIIEQLEQFFQTKNLFRLAATKSSCGVKNAYREPASLGTDRWLALQGAFKLVQQDLIVVDLGSAITIDLLRANGQHLGGAILPGFGTSLKQFKRIMRRVDFDHPEIVHTDDPGCFTEACINIDYQPTETSTVENIVNRWFERLGPKAVLIITGGGANYLHEHLSRKPRLIPDLVFQGMRLQIESQGRPE